MKTAMGLSLLSKLASSLLSESHQRPPAYYRAQRNLQPRVCSKNRRTSARELSDPPKNPVWDLSSRIIWILGKDAVSEDRTHDLRIMRPTRCQLRYHRSVTIQVAAFFRTERWLRGCACQQKVASSIPQCCRGVRASFPGFRRCRFR